MEEIDGVEREIRSCVARGETLVYEEKKEEWEKFVKEALSRGLDSFGSMALYWILKIMQKLGGGMSVQRVAEEFKEEQFASLDPIIRLAVLKFSKKGPEFFEAVYEVTGEKMTEKEVVLWNAQIDENEEYEQNNQERLNSSYEALENELAEAVAKRR